MAFISIPNGIKIEMEYILNGEIVVNVYYVTRSAPIVTANLTQIAQLMRDWWNTNLKLRFTNQISLVAVVATNWSVEDGEQYTLVVSPAIAGSVAPPTAPNNVAIVTTFLTPFTGRSFRGRKYYAGIAAAEIADNFVSAGYVTNLQADHVTLDGNLTSLGYELVVASFQANLVPRVVGVATPITGYRVDGRVDTQRRRLPGQGI